MNTGVKLIFKILSARRSSCLLNGIWRLQVIPVPSVRSQKWISTSISKNEEQKQEGGVRCSAEYFVNNMRNTVLFEEATRAIPDNAIVVEISAHCLLRALINRTKGSNGVTYLSLAVKQCPNSVEYFLQCICKYVMYSG